MGKRKRNKNSINIIMPCSSIQNSMKKIDTNINKINIDFNCSKDVFSLNFSKWMNEIFYNIQINNNDQISEARILIKRAEYFHGDMCKQYFCDHAGNLVSYVIGSTNTEILQLRLKVLLLCLQYVPSVFGPYKTKIEVFLSNLIKSDKNLEEIVKILSKCLSYLPILGGSGTNNQNHVNSWITEFDRHLNKLDQILDHTMDYDVSFSIHCQTIVNLVKLNLPYQAKIPINRILEIVAKVINYGLNNEQFRKINVDVKTYFSLDILVLLDGLIVVLGDLLWPYADMIFNYLVKFVRFLEDLSTTNSFKRKLKCQIYSMINNCLLLNYPCKLQSILNVVSESLINDAQPKYLNEVDTSLQTITYMVPKNKKRKHHTRESLNLIGSSRTNNLPSKINGHDWLDFESLEMTCLAALNVLMAISAMDPLLISSEKNENKRNRVELMTPIWKFTVETLVKLRTYKDVMHPYSSTECRLVLFSLMQQHVSDHMFYTSRYCGCTYLAICVGNEDPDLRIRLLCHNVLATYNQFCSLKITKSNSNTEQIFPMEQSIIDNSIFSSCKNITLNDNHTSVNNNSTILFFQNHQKSNLEKTNFQNIPTTNSNNNKAIFDGDTSLTLSDSQYTDADASLNHSLEIIDHSNLENILNNKAEITSDYTRTLGDKMDIQIKDNGLKDNFDEKSIIISVPIVTQEQTLIPDVILNENLNFKPMSEIDIMLSSFVDADPD